MKTLRTPVVGILSVLLLFCAVQTWADVFLKISGNSSAVIESVGGSRVYGGPVKVNGVEAKIEVYAFKELSETVGRSLLKRFGLDAGRMREGALVKLPPKFGHAWVFILPGMTGDASSAILIEAESALSVESAQWIFPDIPPPPGFTPEFSVSDAKSRMDLCIGVSETQAGVSMQVMAGVLTRAGWTLATPAGKNLSSALFANGNDVATVSVIPRETGCSVLVMKSSK